MFPALSAVRISLVLSNCERCVEKQNPRLSPGNQAAVINLWRSNPKVRIYLFKNIYQRRRLLNAFLNRESHTVSLSFLMIWILSEEQNLYIVIRSVSESCKYLIARWKYCMVLVFFVEKSLELAIVRFLHLFSEYGIPFIPDFKSFCTHNFSYSNIYFLRCFAG